MNADVETRTESPPALSVLLLCIAYGNHSEVSAFLEKTLSEYSGGRICTVVIENTLGRSPHEVSWLGKHGRDAYDANQLLVVGDGANHGYFGAFRLGLASASERWNQSFNWTVLSNTDLLIKTRRWVDALAKYESHIAVVAPRIISELSGKNQNPLYHTRPSPGKFLLLSYIFRSSWATGLHRWGSLLKSRLLSKLTRHDLAQGTPIYAAHGSFLCLSKDYFVRGGRLECPTFLYCEELFLAEEVRSLEMKIVYDPCICVLHQEHASTSFIPKPKVRAFLAEAHYAVFHLLSR